MRNAFAKELTALAKDNEKIVMLSGDIGNRLFDDYKKLYPERFLNCGVAEANMIGVASGLALSGFRSIAYTITPFITTRCFEQIRVDLCYHNAPVIIVGVGSGLSYGTLGTTHHSCEDIAILRALPNMTVMCPGDPYEVRAALRAASFHNGPVYIRIGKKGEPLVHKEIPNIVIGKALTIQDGSDVCLLSTGNMLPIVVNTAEELAKEGISAKVMSFHTVKPLDEEALSEIFSKFDVVCTVEEHSLIGGFGSGVAEWMIDNNITKKLLRFGTPDKFIHHVGSQEYCREQYGLTADAMSKKILRNIQNIPG